MKSVSSVACFLIFVFTISCLSCKNSARQNNKTDYNSQTSVDNQSNNSYLNTVSSTDSPKKNPIVFIRYKDSDKSFSYSIQAEYATYYRSLTDGTPRKTILTYCLTDSSYKTKDSFNDDVSGYDITQLCFSTNDGKFAEGDPPITRGFYKLAGATAETEKITRINISSRRNNKLDGYTIDTTKAQGSITIENSDKKAVSGKINVSDDKLSISGDFESLLP